MTLHYFSVGFFFFVCHLPFFLFIDADAFHDNQKKLSENEEEKDWDKKSFVIADVT